MIKITHNGQPFDAKKFGDALREKGIELGMQALEEKARGAASSIIDPETQKHADVFVDRTPDNRVIVRTIGSQAYARLLEDRLGVDRGSVELTGKRGQPPEIYLAHASEDKPLVRPVAEYLMKQGVKVWFDEWDIEPGDSLREKMEEGLGAMTHFVVVLTPAAISKPWVAKEIDVGLVRQVGGKSRFIPVVVGVSHDQLSPFLQAMLYLTVDLTNQDDWKALADRIHGVSRKPPLGDPPAYVKQVPEGLAGWSDAAIAVARQLVTTSEHAMPHDPIMTIDGLATATGLAEDDVRLGVLDLKDAGLLWEANIKGHVAAEASLFVEFDAAFMDFDPAVDAVRLANEIVRKDKEVAYSASYAEELDWEPRRLNSAICYLLRAGAIKARHAFASPPWRAIQLIKTDRTLRFARNHD